MILSTDNYIKYPEARTKRTDANHSPFPPVLEKKNANNDSQLTDEILTMNGDTISIPITDELVNVTFSPGVAPFCSTAW